MTAVVNAIAAGILSAGLVASGGGFEHHRHHHHRRKKGGDSMTSRAKSTLIYSGSHFEACELPSGNLVVTNRRTGRGVQIPRAVAIAGEWTQSIREAAQDAHGLCAEAHALCRALVAEARRRDSTVDNGAEADLMSASEGKEARDR